MRFRSALLGALSMPALLTAAPALAQKVGSGNTVVVEPRPETPKETPCVVPLVTGAVFGATNADFSYTPPANCPGPWAKVLLQVQVSLDAGIQYDRTGTLWIGGAPLWFGTTSEPNPHLGPHWKFSRDVTDFTALLATPQSGFEIIANYTNSQDTSVITSSASLLFYPATTQYPAPITPDLVVPMAADGGGTVSLNTPTDTLSISPTLPTNVAKARLDLYLQGQGGDEFWYTCVPNTLSTELESCGGGSLREGEITIDGTPAGVAPIYPWIFTGGIDPYLWAPIPGVQTLNFDPFHIELTPFAGVLSNGAAHNVSVSVYGDNNSFSAAGALFVYLDHNSTTVTGAVTRNTLAAAPNPKITNNITTVNGVILGALNTASIHNYTISGYANTSAGRVTTTVQQATTFTNDQYFKITNSTYLQSIKQATKISANVTSTGGAAPGSSATTYNYPLDLSIFIKPASGGLSAQTTKVNQQLLKANTTESGGVPTGQYNLSDARTATDTLLFNSSFQIVGNHGQASTGTYLQSGTTIPCLSRQFAAANSVLTAAQIKFCK
jgi:hypothetical protein